MKKLLSLLLSAVLLCGVFAACSNGQKDASAPATDGSTAGQSAQMSQTAGGETVKCVYYVPGDEPQELARALGDINAKLAEDNVGVELELKYVPWDAWDQKINIMLSTGEAFDLFHVMNDRVSLTNYAARGALADITDAMEQYGQNIKAVNPEMMMRSGQVEGVQYAIPAYWVESALNPEITLRKDLLEKYGIEEVPTTFEELTDAYVQVMENCEGTQKPYLPLIGANAASFGPAAKTYSTWPYHVYDKIFYVNQDGTIKNFFETEEFKQDAANARSWYEKGLINPDVLVFTSDQNTNQLNSGDWFVHFGTIGNITPMLQNYPDLTTEDFIWLDFDSSKPKIRPYGTRNMNAVPLSSKNPEAAVKFMNWVYAEQENYDLFIYGKEGVDYNKVEPQNREPIINPATNQELYFFSDWMVGNVQFIRPGTTAPEITNEALYQKNESAVEGIAAMFTFDASNVQTQMADVQTQIQAVITPIATGVVDYDSNIDQALDLLRKAGIDDLVAEFIRQYEASK